MERMNFMSPKTRGWERTRKDYLLSGIQCVHGLHEIRFEDLDLVQMWTMTEEAVVSFNHVQSARRGFLHTG